MNLCLFGVSAVDSPAPYSGDPPPDAVSDCEKIVEQIDLDKESSETTLGFPFCVDRPPGYYYVQLRVILFQSRSGKLFAQAEQFFFGRRPVHLVPESEDDVTFAVSWPVEPLERLHHYGTLRPQ